MLAAKLLLFVPLFAGSLAFTCGGDARAVATTDDAPRLAPAAVAAPPKNCPTEAEVSRILGRAVKPMAQSIGCAYSSDDQSYSADIMHAGAATGAQLMDEVREEAKSRHLATEATDFGDRGVLWAEHGDASGAVVGNGKAAYADVTMGDQEKSATKAALVT